MYNFQIHTEVEDLWVDTVIYLSWEKLLLLVVDCSCMCLLSVQCHTVFTLLIHFFQSRTNYSFVTLCQCVCGYGATTNDN